MATFLDNNDEVIYDLTEQQDMLFDKEYIPEKNKNTKSSRLLNGAISICLAASVCLCGYVSFFTYCINRNKYLSDANLFNGNYISENISEEEKDEIVDSLEEELNCEISDDQINEYCLLDAIKNNKSLSETEKEHFYKYIDLILDNPYLDKESVYHAFRNVTVHNWLFRPAGVSQVVNGDYDYKNGIIRIFDRKNSPLDHEGIHCIFFNEKTSKLPKYFGEGMTELLSNEYFSEKPYFELQTYPFEVLSIKMLCELTSSDTVLKAFTYGDMSIIAEELATMSGTVQEAEIALNGLEYYFNVFNGQEEMSEFHEVIISNFMNYFDSCITTKDSNSLERKSYFSNLVLFLNIFKEEPYEMYIDDLQEYGYIRRAYFSSKLKDSESDITKTYSKSR